VDLLNETHYIFGYPPKNYLEQIFKAHTDKAMQYAYYHFLFHQPIFLKLVN